VGVIAAGCAEVASDACADGTYCPVGSTCGTNNVCIAHERACSQFADGMPCLVDKATSGFCADDACSVGFEVIGYGLEMPTRSALAGMSVEMRGHPEVGVSLTNVNGYFSLRTPRLTTGVITLTWPEAFVTITRPVTIREAPVTLELSYGGIPIVPRLIAQALASQAGITLSPERGIVMGQAYDLTRGTDDAGGLSVSVPPGRCAGPLYFDASGTIVPTASATIAGAGVFVLGNCETGDLPLTMTSAIGPCRTLDSNETTTIVITPEPEKVLSLGRIACAPP